MKKNLFIFPVVLALLASCSEKTETNVVAQVEELPAVKVKQVFSQDVDQLVEFTANVEANKTNAIAPQSPVRITDIKAEVGDQVKAGQVLVVMDNTNLAQAKVQLDNKKIEFQRVDELYKVGGASKSEWDSKKMSLDVAQTSYDNMLENTTLASPISGVVTARNYDKGDLYAGQPVLVVEQIAPVKLIINVNEQYYSMVKKGMNIDHITLDAYPGEVFKGKVSIVYPTLDANSRTFPVEVKIDNANQRVRPGMFARVQINFGTQKNIVVPDQAVIKQVGSGDRFVYVVNADNTVTYSKVVLGRRMSTEYEVVEGLADGATVVVFGQNRLVDGKEVKIID